MALRYKDYLVKGISREEDECCPTDEAIEPNEAETTNTVDGFGSVDSGEVEVSERPEIDFDSAGEVTEAIEGGEETDVNTSGIEAAEGVAEANAEIESVAADIEEREEVVEDMEEQIEANAELLEKPSEVTSEQAKIAILSLQANLRALGINPNKSKAVKAISAESCEQSPAKVLQMVTEETVGIWAKTKEAISKAWKWICAQFKRLWNWLKSLLPTTYNKAVKLLKAIKDAPQSSFDFTKENLDKVAKAYPVLTLANGTVDNAILKILNVGENSVKAMDVLYKYLDNLPKGPQDLKSSSWFSKIKGLFNSGTNGFPKELTQLATTGLTVNGKPVLAVSGGNKVLVAGPENLETESVTTDGSNWQAGSVAKDKLVKLLEQTIKFTDVNGEAHKKTDKVIKKYESLTQTISKLEEVEAAEKTTDAESKSNWQKVKDVFSFGRKSNVWSTYFNCTPAIAKIALGATVKLVSSRTIAK